MKRFLPKIKKHLALIIISMPIVTWGGTDSNANDSKNEPPEVGNFSLSTSQQPGPFLSFGQTLIEKNQVQLYLGAGYLKVQSDNFLTLTPSAVYGLSDKAALLLSVPVALDYEVSKAHSHGLGDIYLQGEYGIYDFSNSKYTEGMTIVGGLTAPTGSFYKSPPTGLGTTSFFLGTTYNRMSVEWLAFASTGVVMITNHDDIKLGNQYLYQLGLGHNIKSEPGKYIFSSLIELNGIYARKNKIFGEFDPDSGGNLIYIIPSL
ncbi:hypothetical protein ACNVED_08435 [Legionella sp. D16C41]|uniref:hypothetical protein n=1 Tax=Legionella sp. D16C41 TaxID=3402688 RepID=UPI003AF44CDB